MDLASPSIEPHVKVVLDAFGVAVGLTISGQHASELRSSLLTAWSRCLAPGTMPQAHLDVRLDESRHHDEVMSALTSHVTLAAIEARAGQLMMLHAAAVSDAKGGVWGLVAPSGTGKTTAATHLSRRFGYVTDETLAVSFTGRVFAYPKPLSVGLPGTVKAQVSPDQLGVKLAPSELRLAGLILLERDARLPFPHEAIELGLLESCALLVPHTSFLSKVPAPLDELVAMVERVGGVTRLRYRDATELDGALEELGIKQP